MTGRHVVITGGMGFLGSHLADAFVLAGSNVTVIDDLSTGRLENVARLQDHPRYSQIVADVRDPVSREVMERKADLIVHMAAAVGVRQIMENPVETIDTNVATTTAVLQAARARNVKVLLASTSEVYGKSTSIPSSEEDDIVLGPPSHLRWSYAASKITDELMALGCSRQFGLPVVIVRFFNVTGPRQSELYVLPRFAAAALAGQVLEIHGDGAQTRSFTHVADAVRAVMLLAANASAVGEVFNIGTPNEVSIGDLARRVMRAVGVVSEKEISDRCRFVPYREVYGDTFDDFERRLPDVSKLASCTGWRPEHDLDRMIEDVISGLR